MTEDLIFASDNLHGYVDNSPISYYDYTGLRKKKPPENKKHPKSDKLGSGCKPVYFTGDKVSPGKHLGTPSFPRGSTVCIHGINENISRKVDDCGCGLKIKDKPDPDNWMDFQTDSCDGFSDGWRCVCGGKCPK